MTEEQLIQAEHAIEELASAMNISEQEVVIILRKGLQAMSPSKHQLRNKDEAFISEMESTFGVR